MQARTIAQRVVTVLVAAALLALSSGMAWAAVSDYQEASFIPEGVSINGVGLGGMTETEAREAIEDAVSAPLLRPVPVTADGKTYTFDPKGTVSVDVDAMVEQAFAPRRSASIITRARHDLLGTPIAAEVDPVYSVDKKKVTKWVSGVA
ncbi:MAG TPA: hypothetical protein VLA05_06700, partial [Coriobacteriia bacterium]|nr:hypothetical protein [Coriobacteriia bacterium]